MCDQGRLPPRLQKRRPRYQQPKMQTSPPNWGNKCHIFKFQFLSLRLTNQPPTLSPCSSSRGISVSVPPRSQRLAVTLDLHHSPVFISYLPLLAPSPWSPARRPPRLEPILACCLAWVLITFCFDPSSSPCYSLPPCRAVPSHQPLWEHQVAQPACSCAVGNICSFLGLFPTLGRASKPLSPLAELPGAKLPGQGQQ